MHCPWRDVWTRWHGGVAPASAWHPATTRTRHQLLLVILQRARASHPCPGTRPHAAHSLLHALCAREAPTARDWVSITAGEADAIGHVTASTNSSAVASQQAAVSVRYIFSAADAVLGARFIHYRRRLDRSWKNRTAEICSLLHVSTTYFLLPILTPTNYTHVCFVYTVKRF